MNSVLNCGVQGNCEPLPLIQAIVMEYFSPHFLKQLVSVGQEPIDRPTKRGWLYLPLLSGWEISPMSSNVIVPYGKAAKYPRGKYSRWSKSQGRVNDHGGELAHFLKWFSCHRWPCQAGLPGGR